MEASNIEWLNAETIDLIYLVACSINKAKPDPELIKQMDLDAVYDLASRHMLAATVAPTLKAAGVKNERFISAFSHSVLKNATMDAEMDALFAMMDSSKIWHMPLKGTILQHHYPVYGMREMSDHDILFDAQYGDEVCGIMESLGFSVIHYETDNDDVYYKEPVSNFEMHRTLFSPASKREIYKYYKEMDERLRGSGYEKHLSAEDFYLYLCAHEYKHFAQSGTGLRSLVDTYVYLKNNDIDMEYIQSETEKMDISDFEASNRTLAYHLFTGKELTSKEWDMLKYIMSSETYGTAKNRVENALKASGGKKIKLLWDNFLAPLDKERGPFLFATEYPFFYKHRIFLPLLIFYRAFRVIFVKKGKVGLYYTVLTNSVIK